MPRKTTIFIEYNGQRMSLKDWSMVLNVPLATLTGRYRLYKEGKKDLDYVMQPAKLYKVAKPVTYKQFVFRPEKLEGQLLYYCAYSPYDLKTPVMTDIIQMADGKWAYNCYNIGHYETKTQLVLRYLAIIRIYGSLYNFIEN